MKKIIILIISIGFVVSSCYTNEERKQARIYKQNIVEMFPVGSIVQLKSGGPKMTVTEIHGVSVAIKHPRVECLWIDRNDKKKVDMFDYNLLKPIN